MTNTQMDGGRTRVQKAFYNLPTTAFGRRWKINIVTQLQFIKEVYPKNFTSNFMNFVVILSCDVTMRVRHIVPHTYNVIESMSMTMYLKCC